ncbi:hypothetical protein XENOCAPTIV_008460 [Xenoophorus captivus]|uniref:Uncharacterized protein n=1 Tax=Xenoophorus captivus TaxID=1517983 RepID=A0ABV0RGA3_9TELE
MVYIVSDSNCGSSSNSNFSSCSNLFMKFMFEAGKTDHLASQKCLKGLPPHNCRGLGINSGFHSSVVGLQGDNNVLTSTNSIFSLCNPRGNRSHVRLPPFELIAATRAPEVTTSPTARPTIAASVDLLLMGITAEVSPLMTGEAAPPALV